MKTQKSNDANLDISSLVETSEHAEKLPIKNVAPEDTTHAEEGADQTLECANRRDRRCRKILDTIG